jgi:hypothetical protein
MTLITGSAADDDDEDGSPAGDGLPRRKLVKVDVTNKSDKDDPSEKRVMAMDEYEMELRFQSFGALCTLVCQLKSDVRAFWPWIDPVADITVKFLCLTAYLCI